MAHNFVFETGRFLGSLVHRAARLILGNQLAIEPAAQFKLRQISNGQRVVDGTLIELA